MFGLQKTQECRSRRRQGFSTGLIVATLVGSCSAVASPLDEEITSLKAEVSAHAGEIFQLEQRVLHPVDTRLAIFLTLASRDGLDLDSVEVFVNGKPVASHLYTARESDSLQQGGIQQLFTGNLANGEHKLNVVITARAANDHFVRRESTHRFQKRPGALRLQMALEAKAPESRKPRQQALYEQAELARTRGDTEEVGKILAGMDAGYWSAVGYLNLSGEYARNDLSPSRALVALRVALAMADKDRDTQRKTALRSRILLRAGYLAYTSADYEKAIGFLEKMPLDSHKTPQALYFHGLALAEQGHHRAAMQSWHRAKKYPLAYPGVAEAWIGMGRGYDLSGYLGQAGEAYLAANAAYESERVTLRKLASLNHQASPARHYEKKR